MPNLPSAAKRMRQNRKRRAQNYRVRSRMRTFVRKATDLIEEGDREAAMQAVRAAVSEIDRAAQKGVIHANNAARRKSRLMQRLNAM